ncbi:SCO family protein [Shewanella subflava]|uniref:SCO family protein n=1 Tax=Shewanella subflava TaxID=2986476 RepID=A0ABT3I9B6_9GAMM|nr:SCO family protein [Shewanella subflava]MCW3172666.1 SCO family protein [Shewanella subflava]
MGKPSIIVALMAVAIGGIFAYQWLTPSANTSTQTHQSQYQNVQLDTGFIYDNPRKLATFSLSDQYGNPFTNKDLEGKWSLFFIGFTSCPDVCPTTLNKLAAAYPALQQISADIQVVFVSADPQRDTQVKRLDYINFFNPEFKAITAEHSQLFPFSRDLGFVYAMVGEGDNYQIDHSASYVLVSPQGEKTAVFKAKPKPGLPPQIFNEELIADFKKIVNNA